MGDKQEKNLTIAIIVLILLLLLAIALPIFLRLPSSYSYTGVDDIEYNFSIDKHTGKDIHILPFWVDYATLNKAPQFKKEYIVPFEYSPMELEYILLNGEINDLIFDKDKTRTIYLTRDANLGVETEGKSEVAILTIGRIVGKDMSPAAFKIETISAVTEATEASEYNNVPVRTCEDAGKRDRTVIWLKRGEENGISLDGQCITLEFVKDDDSIAVATKLVYHLIGVV